MFGLRGMRRRSFGVGAVLVVFGAGALLAEAGGGADAETPAAQPVAATDVIRDLLTEKRDILQAAVEMKQRLYQRGSVDMREVQRAELALRETELRLAETPDERLAILEKMIDAAERLEKVAAARVEAATANAGDVLEAKVLRLDLRIRLEEEKAGHAGAR